jgi:hypothetical protein
MKSVGKPDAGNPHVRFDERGRETGDWQSLEAPRPASTLQEVWFQRQAFPTNVLGVLWDFKDLQ